MAQLPEILRSALRLPSSALLLVGFVAAALALPVASTAAPGGPGSGPGQRSELASLVRQSDGKILVVGTTGSCSSRSGKAACPASEVLLARLLADGSPDPGFGRGGLTTAAASPSGTIKVNAAAVQPGGAILVTGIARGAPDAPSKLLLIRFLGDGALDPTFGAGGIVEIDPEGSVLAEGNALAVAPNGDILVAGRAATVGKNPSFLAARFLPDGSLNPGFGEGGVAMGAFAAGLGSSANALALATDGDLILAGGARTGAEEEAFAFARFGPDGRLDPSFGSGGTLTASPFGGSFAAAGARAVVEVGGEILGLGSGSAGEHGAQRTRLVRLEPDGSPDPRLGPGGRLTLAFEQSRNPGLAAATLLANGEALLAGIDSSTSNPPLLLGRFKANGEADPGFRPGESLAPGGGRFVPGTALLDSGGGLIAAATVSAARCFGGVPASGGPCRAIELRRYRSDGSPARGFGSAGMVLVPSVSLCRRAGPRSQACRSLLTEAQVKRLAKKSLARRARLRGRSLVVPVRCPRASVYRCEIAATAYLQGRRVTATAALARLAPGRTRALRLTVEPGKRRGLSRRRSFKLREQLTADRQSVIVSRSVRLRGR